MKPLPKQFPGRGEVKGYLFTQLKQTDKAFIYEVSSGDRKHYEVFKRKLNTQYGCVSFPKSKAFGIWANVYMNLESAIKKFNELNSE